MNFRTDLALEVRENLEGSRIDGVECTSFESAGAEITRLRVTDRRGEEILGKPRGEYITVQSQSFARSSRISDELIDAVAQELSRLLPSEGTVLAAGLGNTNITPDALGPKFIGGVFVTRHLKRELCEQLGLGRLRPVAAIAPGVLGQTGVETGELLLGAVNVIKPCAVIVVDALAARKLGRLGSTVQISDSGIIPGSGVGNSRAEISRKRSASRSYPWAFRRSLMRTHSPAMCRVITQMNLPRTQNDGHTERDRPAYRALFGTALARRKPRFAAGAEHKRPHRADKLTNSPEIVTEMLQFNLSL